MTCSNREWLEDDEAMASGPLCGEPATHYSCNNYGPNPTGLNACKKHKCRCAPKVVAPKEATPMPSVAPGVTIAGDAFGSHGLPIGTAAPSSSAVPGDVAPEWFNKIKRRGIADERERVFFLLNDMKGEADAAGNIEASIALNEAMGRVQAPFTSQAPEKKP